jgi:hypothetical protein
MVAAPTVAKMMTADSQLVSKLLAIAPTLSRASLASRKASSVLAERLPTSATDPYFLLLIAQTNL